MKIDNPLEKHVPELRRLWKEAFGDAEEFLDDFFATAFDFRRCRCAFIDGKAVAVLYWFNCNVKESNVYEMTKQTEHFAELSAASIDMQKSKTHPWAYIYAVATAKEFCGQGISHKLMEDTHEYLKELGYEGTILVPGDEGLFKFYESMGYQKGGEVREFHCMQDTEDDSCCKAKSELITASDLVQSEKASLQGNWRKEKIPSLNYREIEKEEYARLRRKYLPQGGVIQEKENLDFLATQAKFYAGEDFLLVACRDGETLWGVELLVKEEMTDGIMDKLRNMLSVLGYKEGYFRTPVGNLPNEKQKYQGKKMPFAMYYALKQEVQAPTYFGLAFD